VLASEGDVIGEDGLAPLLHGGNNREAAFMPLREAMKQLERRMITEALIKTGGNKTKAAELLDMSYKNLFDKVREYNIGH